MDGIQEEEVFNSLTAIAEAYSDSEEDSDQWSDTENGKTSMAGLGNPGVIEQPRFQSVPSHEELETTPKEINLDIQLKKDVKSTQVDAAGAREGQEGNYSNFTSTIPVKRKPDLDNNNDSCEKPHQDAVYIMSMLGEELKDLEASADVTGVGSVQRVPPGHEAECQPALCDESDSSDDESSSSSDSCPDISDVVKRVVELEDLDDEKVNSSPPRTKDELFLKDLPDEPEVEIEVDENVQLIPIGTVDSIVDILVVIRALPQTPALDSGSYLFLGNREYLGTVFEIFGPVQSPYYSIRFNSKESLENKQVSQGMEVCYAPDITDYSIFVFTEQLRKIRGSDASWRHDQEPPTELIEYSDDEQEQQAKAKKKQDRKAKRDKETGESGQVPSPKQRKVGKWSWRNQQQTPPPSGALVQHSPDDSPSCALYMSPAVATLGPPGLGHPPLRQGPPFDVALMSSYPRGPPQPGLPFRPPPGPLQCLPRMPPHSRPLLEGARPFVGIPSHWNGPPLFRAQFEGARLFRPTMVPYQHGPPLMPPHQHGPFLPVSTPPSDNFNS